MSDQCQHGAECALAGREGDRPDTAGEGGSWIDVSSVTNKVTKEFSENVLIVSLKFDIGE